MSALKFECPACGQPLECERALSGDVIHCPRCCAELRIPFSSVPGSILRAELIMHAPPPKQSDVETPPQSAPAAPAQPEVHEVICPVCESELRVRAGASKHDGQPRLAELIRKGEPKQQQPPAEQQPHEDQGDHKHLTIEERERQIAAAREAHPIQPRPSVKPRLSYVLSGEDPNKEKQKEAEPEHPPFSE